MSRKLRLAQVLLVAALLFSLNKLAARASEPGPVVYVVAAVDTEAENNHNEAHAYHTIFDVENYPRPDPGESTAVSAVMDSSFRESRRDSFGDPFKMSWFLEMDEYINQGLSPDGEPFDYLTFHDLMIDNWGTEIGRWGDEIAYHHHFMRWNGTEWKQAQHTSDYTWHNEALDYMILDGGFFPAAFRSGWLWTSNSLQNWIESWMPIDYSNWPDEPGYGSWYGAPTSWFPYHPSTDDYLTPGSMDHWISRCDGIPTEQSAVDSAFAEALDRDGPVVYCWFSHSRDDMASWVNSAHEKLETASQDTGVSFKYVTATEAMQMVAGCSDTTPPDLSLSGGPESYTITSDEALWGNHPYVAAKYWNENRVVYTNTLATPTGSYTWEVDLPTTTMVTIWNDPLYVASATAEDAKPGYPASNAVDGNPDSYWDSTPAETPTWIQLDLGTAKTAETLSIHFYDLDSREYTYYVESSPDGATWTEIVPASTAHGLASHTFNSPTSLRYLRVRVTDNDANDYAHIKEIALYPGSISTTEQVHLQQVGAGALDRCGNSAVAAQPVTSAIELETYATPPFIYLGEPVTYTHRVENPGNDSLHDVQVTNDTCSPLSARVVITGNVDDALDPGEVWEYTCSQTLTETTTTVGTATGIDSSDQPLTYTHSATISVIDPAIDIDKAATPSQVAAGGTVTYTFTVTNTGDTWLQAVTVSDELCAPISEPTVLSGDGDDALDPNEIWQYTCSTTLYQDTTNQATVQAGDPKGNPVIDHSQEVFVDALPAVAVDMGVTPTEIPEPGGAVTYTIWVSNTSPMEPVSVTAMIDSIYGDLNGQGTCDLPQPLTAGGVYECSFGSLAGDTIGPITNSVTVDVHDDENNKASDTAVASVNVTDVKPSISVRKTASPTVIASATSVDFRIEVENLSVESVTLTSLEDSAFGDLAAECGLPADIAIADSLECMISRTVDSDHTNVITATVFDDEDNVATGTAEARVELVRPEIRVIKTASVMTATVGEVITYTYDVENMGNVPLASVTATDDKLGTIISASEGITLEVGQRVIRTATYTVQEADLPGPLVNSVTVTGTPSSDPDVTDTAIVEVYLKPAPDPTPPKYFIYLPLAVRDGGG